MLVGSNEMCDFWFNATFLLGQILILSGQSANLITKIIFRGFLKILSGTVQRKTTHKNWNLELLTLSQQSKLLQLANDSYMT